MYCTVRIGLPSVLPRRLDWDVPVTTTRCPVSPSFSVEHTHRGCCVDKGGDYDCGPTSCPQYCHSQCSRPGNPIHPTAGENWCCHHACCYCGAAAMTPWAFRQNAVAFLHRQATCRCHRRLPCFWFDSVK